MWLPKILGKVGLVKRGGKELARIAVKGFYSMVGDGILDRLLHPLPFIGQHMDDDRPLWNLSEL